MVEFLAAQAQLAKGNDVCVFLLQDIPVFDGGALVLLQFEMPVSALHMLGLVVGVRATGRHNQNRAVTEKYTQPFSVCHRCILLGPNNRSSKNGQEKRHQAERKQSVGFLYKKACKNNDLSWQGKRIGYSRLHIMLHGR